MKNVVDLFAGAGGLSCGFIRAGYDVLAAVEFDRQIADTYRLNHPNTVVFVNDIKDVAEKKLLTKYKPDVIVGGPPCQGFSMAGARIRKDFISDERNYLFRYYYEVLKQVKPRFFVFENVKGITTMEHGAILNEILALFQNKQMLDGHRYYTYPHLFKASEFGIPQKRERFIILGVLDQKIKWNSIYEKTKEKILSKYPSFFERVTVWDAISDLVSVPDSDKVKVLSETEYQRFLVSKDGICYNNNKPKHTSIALARIKKISEGENWTKLKNEHIKSVHSGAYGRLTKDGLAPTITTRFDTPSGGGFIHPTENRTLTPREGARIQSFPDDYQFVGTKTSVYKQIGNAVPPKLAYFVAEMINMINDNYFGTENKESIN